MSNKLESSRYESVVDNFDQSTHYGRILNLVGKGKKVLELGCSTGYLSEAMSGLFDCEVTGVEVDEAAARKAADKCKRVVVADLDVVKLSEELAGESYDVVLCADVLEHLKDPVALLNDLQALMKPDSCLIASIPNVAHGSIRLALMLGQFPYRSMGLLDETHIRFFNRPMVEELFESGGFKVESVGRNRWCSLHSETGAALPEEARDFIDFLARDPESETYQFLVKASPRKEEERLGQYQKNSSGKETAGEALPDVAFVVSETGTASLDDRFRKYLKLLNYPCERLSYNFVSGQPPVVSHETELDCSPRPYPEHDWTTWRFSNHGEVDKRFMAGSIPDENGVAENKNEHAKLSSITIGEAEYLFFLDTNTYPSADCLLHLVREARKFPDKGIFVPTPELGVSTGAGADAVGSPPFLVRRDVLEKILAKAPGSPIVLKELLNRLSEQTSKTECKASIFFRSGLAEKPERKESWVKRLLGV